MADGRAAIVPFERHADRYDDWYERHEAVYRSEIDALAPLVEGHVRGLEVGVGTGRFAGPLGVEVGVEPAHAAARKAAARGVETVRGVGERLPLADESVDLVLIAAALCFFDDVDAAMRECRRVLDPGGRLVVGFVDREGEIGRRYYEEAGGGPFYQDARFYSVEEIRELLDGHGFAVERERQTLFGPLDAIDEMQPAREGAGEGSFVAVQTRSPSRG